MEKSSITRFYSTMFVTLLTFAFICVSASAGSLGPETRPTIYVDPATYNATRLGELFQINVKVKDVVAESHLTGVEFKLGYNETLIETEEGWVSEGSFLEAFGETMFDAYIETDVQGAKYIYAFVFLLPSETGMYSNFPQGEGTLATITFKASYRAVEPVEASCELIIYDTILVNQDANTILHNVTDGSYQIAPLPYPTLEVSPRKYTALRNGETFDVNVNIEDLDADWHFVGLEFKLRYDVTLLETKPELIVEGDFLRTYGTTWFQAYVENDYGLVGVMVLPNATGVWPGPFPRGAGTIATITFKAIYQPVEPQDSASSVLMLDETILTNDEIETIPHHKIHGEYIIVAATSRVDQYRPIDVQIDVGTIHFQAEIAEFYVLLTDYGRVVDADSISAMLYFEGVQYLNLTTQLQHVAKGLYRMAYTIPTGAQTGTYVLLVQAQYGQVTGSSLRSFLLSATLKDWKAYIAKIRDDIATVVIPSIGQIKVDLQAMNARIVDISEEVVTIETSLGSLTTDISNLNATISRLDGDIVTVNTVLEDLQGKIENIQADIVTIKTSVGDVEVKVSDLPTNVQTSINLLYVTLILALIAAIGAILALFYVRKR